MYFSALKNLFMGQLNLSPNYFLYVQINYVLFPWMFVISTVWICPLEILFSSKHVSREGAYSTIHIIYLSFIMLDSQDFNKKLLYIIFCNFCLNMCKRIKWYKFIFSTQWYSSLENLYFIKALAFIE